MWGSMLIGDDYDTPLVFNDEFSDFVIKNLSQHPNFDHTSVPILKTDFVSVDEIASPVGALTEMACLNLSMEKTLTQSFVCFVK